MPFLETCRTEERVRMLSDYDTGCFSVVDLCHRYGVSRDTFYAWRARRASGEADWFFDRSHATRSCPHRTEAAIEAEIVALRRRFPHTGPRKLLTILARRELGDGPAGGFDDGRHSQAGRADRVDAAPAAAARRAAPDNRSRGRERRMGGRFQGLVPHTGPAPGRSVDDHRQPYPVSDRAWALLGPRRAAHPQARPRQRQAAQRHRSRQADGLVALSPAQRL